MVDIYIFFFLVATVLHQIADLMAYVVSKDAIIGTKKTS